jgi:hypothetical protein
MAPKGMKGSKVSKRKSKPKVIEWVTRTHSRGTRDIAVEVTQATTSKGKTPKQNDRGIENSEVIQHEATLPSMDVDETFWTEEPVTDEQKRVSSPICPSSPAVFDRSLSPRTLTLKNLFLGLINTWNASSIMRVFWIQQHAGAAGLLRLSGGALTASLLLCSARGVAETPTGSFLSTGFRSGQGSTLYRHGFGRLE